MNDESENKLQGRVQETHLERWPMKNSGRAGHSAAADADEESDVAGYSAAAIVDERRVGSSTIELTSWELVGSHTYRWKGT